MSKKLTVLMVSVDAIGHFNACIGIAEQLRDRGHEVVFAVPDSWKNKLTPLGFIEEWYNNSEEESNDTIGVEAFGEITNKMASAFLLTPQEQIKNLVLTMCEEGIRQTKQNDPKIKKIVSKVKPDIIVADTPIYMPSVMNSGLYANIYMYPEELDYTEFRQNPPNFYRFDNFIRSSEHCTFEVPDLLKNKPGKLIYFSMGTIGCSELGMMKRLISILAKSPHRFIISKGPFAEQIDLASNMWGLLSVPQTKGLPLVDLVISHGGNNTFTESLYFGKPLIILPLFLDQHDNAQRAMETGYGLRFNSHKVTEKELLTGIEMLLFDDKIAARLSKICKRIQASNCISGIEKLIENVAKINII